MRKRIDANIQSFSPNCDQMSFFSTKKNEEEDKFDNYRFRDKHHQVNFRCHHWRVHCENEQIYTDGDREEEENSSFPTFNISLSIGAH